MKPETLITFILVALISAVTVAIMYGYAANCESKIVTRVEHGAFRQRCYAADGTYANEDEKRNIRPGDSLSSIWHKD